MSALAAANAYVSCPLTTNGVCLYFCPDNRHRACIDSPGEDDW